LLTEKKLGLSIISAEGEQSELIEGTPGTYGGHITLNSLEYGLGWMMDVAVHPEYAQNGWIYLHFGDLCSECSEELRDSRIPHTMNRLVRGRIEDGAWVDEEVIWRAEPETYTQTPDMAAGGRTAFDGEGHVFLSVGMKGTSNYMGIQDLSLPYGKIHRVHDDGRIPSDNPFIDEAGALKTIWSYGHRSPQGLEFNLQTRQLWGTEMGPRGGDEVNLLLPGRNYGWPLYSKGVDYDGTPVEYGKELGIELDLADIEQPVVDLTPSPAISSFIFYGGNAFPEWQDDIIVGSLKATELYRIVLDGDQWVHTEILLQDLARVRDVEAGPDGAIYLLLEHASGGQIIKLVPAGRPPTALRPRVPWRVVITGGSWTSKAGDQRRRSRYGSESLEGRFVRGRAVRVVAASGRRKQTR
jgi:glucose/arabinose dehydrogenase